VLEYKTILLYICYYKHFCIQNSLEDSIFRTVLFFKEIDLISDDWSDLMLCFLIFVWLTYVRHICTQRQDIVRDVF